MPRGNQVNPKIETKLTAITMSCNGKKVQLFLQLPIICNRAVLPINTANKIMDDLGAQRGDTVSTG